MGLETLQEHCEDMAPQHESLKRSAGEKNTMLDLIQTSKETPAGLEEHHSKLELHELGSAHKLEPQRYSISSLAI